MYNVTKAHNGTFEMSHNAIQQLLKLIHFFNIVICSQQKLQHTGFLHSADFHESLTLDI